MNFTEIAETRQSCRSYDTEREVEQEKLEKILSSVGSVEKYEQSLPSTPQRVMNTLRTEWFAACFKAHFIAASE